MDGNWDWDACAYPRLKPFPHFNMLTYILKLKKDTAALGQRGSPGANLASRYWVKMLNTRVPILKTPEETASLQNFLILWHYGSSSKMGRCSAWGVTACFEQPQQIKAAHPNKENSGKRSFSEVFETGDSRI